MSDRERAPADIEVGGGLRAREVRWYATPRTHVRTLQGMEREEAGERRPEQPLPGRRYRDVLRRWRLRAGATRRNPSA